MVIDYQVRLSTELSVQLETELMTETEAPVRKALERWLEPIFTDKAQDIDLRFFAGETDVIRHQIQEVINDNRTSYTIKLPKENYMHLAVANIADNRQVQLSAGEHSATMALCLQETQELTPLTTGVFTARLPMTVTDTTKHFDVKMYMVTSAVALVIDTALCGDLRYIDAYMSGSACTFSIRDSLFSYDRACRLLMERVPTEGGVKTQESGIRKQLADEEVCPLACMATVSMPTRDEQTWSLTVTATLSNNRHTTTTLTIEEPLKAGTLRIIKCEMNENGELDPDPKHNSEVGASVTLDWKPGTSQDIDL